MTNQAASSPTLAHVTRSVGADAPPNFLILSPPRCASTWLYENLRHHPEIFLPPVKELKYFSNFSRMCGPEWYLAWFQGAEAKRRGEASPSYTVLPRAQLQQVKALCPELRLVFIFRDPVERAWSHIKHQFQYRENTFSSMRGAFEALPRQKLYECLTTTSLLAYSDYLSILKRWMEFYPKASIYINFFDSVVENPELLLRDVCRHLGVSTDVTWPISALRERFNSSGLYDVPRDVAEFLIWLLSVRTKEFAKFVSVEFGPTVPGTWDYLMRPERPSHAVEPRQVFFSGCDDDVVLTDLLVRESIFSTHVQPLLSDYKGFTIVGFRDECIAISKHIGDASIADMPQYEYERLKREGHILSTGTMADLLHLIDTISDMGGLALRPVQLADALTFLASHDHKHDQTISNLEAILQQKDRVISDYESSVQSLVSQLERQESANHEQGRLILELQRAAADREASTLDALKNMRVTMNELANELAAIKSSVWYRVHRWIMRE
jgi:hypothetical protein